MKLFTLLLMIFTCLFISEGCRHKSPSVSEVASAIKNGRQQVIEDYITRGGNVNSPTPDGDTLLNQSIYYKKWDIAILFVRSGANVNQSDGDGNSPLHLAAVAGHNDFIKLLIEKGADVRKVQTLGYTPVFIACMYHNKSAIQEILDADKSVVNVRTPGGETPLMRVAADANTLEIIQLLMESGADPKLRNSKGMSAEDIAKKAGQPSTVISLFSAPRK